MESRCIYKNYSFICDKSRKAIFGLQKKLKCVKVLTPEIRFDIFDTMIRPIITYGSDVWGLCKSGLHDLDKLFLNYIRCVLCIKATTSNIIVYGECGKFPPSIYCHVNVLCYLHRLLTMHRGSTVKSVFNVLCNLNDQGFQTWISRAYDLATIYQIDMNSCADLSSSQFKKFCYERLKNSLMNSWVGASCGCAVTLSMRPPYPTGYEVMTFELYRMNDLISVMTMRSEKHFQSQIRLMALTPYQDNGFHLRFRLRNTVNRSQMW